MSDEDFVLDSVDEKVVNGHRRFPAAIQFIVLVLILGGLLGGVVFPRIFPNQGMAQKAAPAPTTIAESDVVTVRNIEAPTLEAKSVYVYDVIANRALYSKNADEALPLASITKLMTALVSREIVADDTRMKVPKAATTQVSASGLLWGEVLTASELRDYAMLASSNDAAYTLATKAGDMLADDRGSEAFVAAMNITAEELNLETLRFYNPTGLDISAEKAGAYGSARDVSFLMTYILKNYQEILEPTTMAYERIYNVDGTYHEAENTNPAINAIPNLIGSKTGYTDLASGNLTIAFDAGYNRPIVITVLGSSYDGRFRDVLALTAAVQEAFKKAETAS
jgi:serine-type D-Ala-D-Ala endopeptidase (penicillin-binding protein 7)